MPAVSLVLGLLAFCCMIGGIFTAMIPFVGSALSFGAPILSLFGLVIGGVALSRAQRTGDSTSMATAGLVTNGIGFVFSLVFALTCGMCNACVSSAAMNHQQRNWGPGPVLGQPNIPNAPVVPIAPVTVPPFPSAPPDPAVLCARARTCCLSFAEGDAEFCDQSIAAARQGLGGEACEHLSEGWGAGLRAMGSEVPEECAPPSTHQAVCSDACVHANDGECDDGRPGADTSYCAPGTDCGDCGP